MPSLPSLFVSHGSPMLALDAGNSGAAWARIAAKLPKPRAVVVASAHWLTEAPAVNSTARPTTIHDFYGFPAPLFQIEYPAPGAPAVADQVATLLAQAGFTCGVDAARGLDHGAWVPLKNMYPAADVPVLQLAIQPHASPEHHYRLGLALAGLRESGVLLLGSGSITHNLRELSFGAPEGEVAAQYVLDFQEWMREQLVAGELASLLDYRRQAPAAQRAHPTDEHLLPLFVAMGAGGADGTATRLHDGITEGGLAMDVYAFG